MTGTARPGAGTAMPAPGEGATGVRPRLPVPTGRSRVGTVSLHLVDESREDTLAPTPRPRELMVRLWYPATRSNHHPAAAYLPPTHSAMLVRELNGLTGATHPAGLFTFPTNSRAGAPADGTRHPVVLLSPALGTNAALYTGLAEELASRGYVVAGIDHTYDATVVEFPGELLAFQNPLADTDNDRLLAIRVADTRFVLDALTDLAAARRLPSALGRAMDLSSVAMLGHSRGSVTTVGAMVADRRIGAGIALDGNPLGPAVLDRPFMMLGHTGHRRAEDPDWAAFHDRLRGRRLHVVVDGVGHDDLSDVTVFKSVVDLGTVFSLGPIDGARSLAVQRRYVTAWLDLALRGRRDPVLAAESREFPEVDFQP